LVKAFNGSLRFLLLKQEAIIRNFFKEDVLLYEKDFAVYYYCRDIWYDALLFERRRQYTQSTSATASAATSLKNILYLG